MANETVFTGLAHPTDVYGAGISAALIKAVVLPPLIYSESLPVGTNLKNVKKLGNLTSSSGGVAEGANYTTLSQWTTTGVLVTTIKDVVSTFTTVESMQFSPTDEALMVQEIGLALAREMDAEILAMFAGFANLVTATSVLTIADVMDAAYTVRAAIKGAGGVRRLRAFLNHKGAHEIAKEIVASSASVFTIPSNNALFGEDPLVPNGYKGQVAGIEIYESSGHATTGGNNIQAVVDPGIALAAVYGAGAEMLPPIWRGQGTVSFGVELSGLMWHGVSEWNDTAGCELQSDS